MNEKADQFIGVYLTSLEFPVKALSYAVPIAKIVNKALVLLYIKDPNYSSQNESIEIIEKKIIELQKTLSSTGVVTTYCILQGKTQEILKTVVDHFNIVCVVTALQIGKKHTVDSPYELLKNFERVKSAYLFVQESLPDEQVLKDIVFSVDFEKETKEKVSWASYFGRFNKSLIHALHCNYKDEFLYKSTENNKQFIKKMFESLDVKYLFGLLSTSSSPDKNTVEYAAQQNAGLVIATSTKGKTTFDFLRLRPEYKTIQNKYKIPVLLLNPREDIYVLCD